MTEIIFIDDRANEIRDNLSENITCPYVPAGTAEAITEEFMARFVGNQQYKIPDNIIKKWSVREHQKGGGWDGKLEKLVRVLVLDWDETLSTIHMSKFKGRGGNLENLRRQMIHDNEIPPWWKPVDLAMFLIDGGDEKKYIEIMGTLAMIRANFGDNTMIIILTSNQNAIHSPDILSDIFTLVIETKPTQVVYAPNMLSKANWLNQFGLSPAAEGRDIARATETMWKMWNETHPRGEGGGGGGAVVVPAAPGGDAHRVLLHGDGGNAHAAAAAASATPSKKAKGRRVKKAIHGRRLYDEKRENPDITAMETTPTAINGGSRKRYKRKHYSRKQRKRKNHKKNKTYRRRKRQKKSRKL